MLELIYNLFIMPIELIVQITFYVMYKVFRENCGIAIVAVGLVIQTLVLPLYNRADKVQEEERKRQKEMSQWITHIKRTFKGEERFMMLSYYYKTKNYKPVYALKSSISLLLQIPFFIAAYHYLSNLTMLNGEKFLFINDLGKPDAVASVAGFSVNIMPIVMTVINILAGAIYTKGWPIKEKMQTYILAVFFLVFLYNSPSGLVLYWTVNQIYSLIKNVAVKYRAGFLQKKKKHCGSVLDKYLDRIKIEQSRLFGTYLVVAAFASLFIGGLIPINIINSSAAEFITATEGPLIIIVQNLAVFVGLFMIYGGMFCWLAKEKYRPVFILIMIIISVTGIADYLFWGNNFGTMSELLVYEKGREFSQNSKIINTVVVLVIIMIIFIFTYYFMDWTYSIFRVLLMVIAVYSLICAISINKQISGANTAQQINDKKILNISRGGHNVIVFMLDRAIDAYIPFIFEERPDLKDAYAGFTWYPNTISHGAFTNYGVPGLYGGYEYTPYAMNERKEERLADKHDEALKVLPGVFGDAGYNVTVCDPPYAGYDWIPDLSIYDDCENVKAYNITGSKGGDVLEKKKQQSAFIYHCIMRAAPVVCQKILYKDGKYMSEYMPLSIDLKFSNCYSALVALKNMTQISEDDSNNFLQLQNEITHNPVLLKTPEYKPAEDVSSSIADWNAPYNGENKVLGERVLKMENVNQAAHYHVNVAALSLLAEWFAYLKENDCWDNTRIIITSDHGRDLCQLEDMILDNGLDVEVYNPLLLVKDFWDTEFKESAEFMTNADVPALAVAGLIDEPLNPFTGNRLDKDYKSGKQMVTTSYNWRIVGNNACEFDTSDGHWYEVTPGNILDVNNWKLID